MARVHVLFIMLLVVLALSGAALAQDDAKTLVIAHAEVTDSLDPARGYTQTVGIVNKATYDTLVTFPVADASEILPMLATDWTISEDGLTYTFTLREGVVFNNGDPLTADDVVFSINRLKNVQGSPSFLAANIASVEAADDQTVVITLATRDSSLLAKLGNTVFAISNADQIRANGGTDAADAATADTGEAYLNSTSAGTGPYVLESWEPQVETVLVRNENYWGEAPYFDRVIIQNIPEAAAQLAALQAGDADMALDLTSDQGRAMEGAEGIMAVETPGNIVHFLLMNRNEEQCGPTADPLVAEAIRLSLDYAGYLALWGGVTPAAPTGVALYTGYGADHASPRDLDQARTLLADAGYADGLELELDYPTLTYLGVNMDTNAQKIQSDLAEAGITVTLNPAEVGVALEEYRTGQECFGYWFWGPDILDSTDALAFMPGGKVATERALWAEDQVEQEVLDWVAQARVETDPDARVQVFTQLYDYLQEQGPWAPFAQPSFWAGVAEGIEGYTWHPQWIVDVAELSRAE